MAAYLVLGGERVPLRSCSRQLAQPVLIANRLFAGIIHNTAIAPRVHTDQDPTAVLAPDEDLQFEYRIAVNLLERYVDRTLDGHSGYVQGRFFRECLRNGPQ